jgi:alkaline phosphatase D
MEPNESPAGWNSHDAGPLLSGPMLGEVGERDAHVWVQARDTSPLTLTVRRSSGETIHRVVEPAASDWLCVTFHVDGLEPGEVCEYTIESRHGATARHRLRTAPAPRSRRVKIAFGSCYHAYDRALPIFDSIGCEGADLFMMVGDNCYYGEPDWNSEHTMMLAQLRNRNNDSLRRLVSSTPVLGIYDDHDFGPNDTGAHFHGKDSALRAFKRSWAQRAYGTPSAPGIFSAMRFGPVEIFLLDGRYERVEKSQILGPAQLAWLMDRLAASDAPVKLVVSGSQVLPEVPAAKEWECWRRDAPRELEALRRFIEEREVRGVVFASGDVHLGYVLHEEGRALPDGRRGPELWELTSSPLANDPWKEHLVAANQPYDPYLMRELTAQNYGVIDVDLDRSGEEIRLILKDERGAALAEQAVALSSLAARSAPGKLSAAAWNDGAIHFFKGSQCLRYDTEAGRAGADGPRSIAETWSDLWPSGIEAAVTWNNGKAYFFKRNAYIRYDIASRCADAGYPRYIATSWKGLWPGGVEAGVAWPNGKAFFFKGSEYIRYDMAADRADPGYPKAIAENWPGLWADGIEAALIGKDGKAYFFRGSEYIRYDIAADRADPGYPRPIQEDWPGLFDPDAIA